MKSNQLYEYWCSGSEKFDYFIIGMIGTICAYIIERYSPEKIAFSPNTLELLSLFVLMASVVCGFYKIEMVLKIRQGNSELSKARERMEAENIHAPKGGFGDRELHLKYMHTILSKEQQGELSVREVGIEKNCEKLKIFHHCRNWLLIIGFILIIVAKLWSVY